MPIVEAVAIIAEKTAEVAVKVVEVTGEVIAKTGEVAGKTMEIAAKTGESAGKTMETVAKTGEAAEKTVETAAKATQEVSPFVENIGELSNYSIEGSSERCFLYSKLEEVQQYTPEQLQAKMDDNLEMQKEPELDMDYEQFNSREGLTNEEKDKLKEETGWSDEIVDSISSIEEAEIYKGAGLVETEIGGKPCLIRPDIDWEQKDQFGRTNAERVKQGLAPIDTNGQPLELHHIGQHNNSPLAELTMQEHRGKGNDTLLHDKSKESEIDRPSFGTERAEHWKERSAAEGVNGNE